VTAEILELCDIRRELKKGKNSSEGAQKYRVANNKVKRGMKKAKKAWIEQKCTEIQTSLKQNNTKKAYEVVKELTKDKSARPTNIQSKTEKCLTKEADITTLTLIRNAIWKSGKWPTP